MLRWARVGFALLSLPGLGCRTPDASPHVEWVCIGVVSDEPQLYEILDRAGIPHGEDGSVLYGLMVPRSEAQRATALLLEARRGKGVFWFMTRREFGEVRVLQEALEGSLRRGEAAREAGDVDRAVGAFTAVLRMAPPEPLYLEFRLRAHFCRAAALEALGERDGAISDLEEGLRLGPDSNWGWKFEESLERLRGPR